MCTLSNPWRLLAWGSGSSIPLLLVGLLEIVEVLFLLQVFLSVRSKCGKSLKRTVILIFRPTRLVIWVTSSRMWHQMMLFMALIFSGHGSYRTLWRNCQWKVYWVCPKPGMISLNLPFMYSQFKYPIFLFSLSLMLPDSIKIFAGVASIGRGRPIWTCCWVWKEAQFNSWEMFLRVSVLMFISCSNCITMTNVDLASSITTHA